MATLEEVVQRILNSQGDAALRMGGAIRPLSQIPGVLGQKAPLEVWESLRAINWARDVRGVTEWLGGLLKVSPLKRRVKGLWFAVPEIELNPAELMCAGFAKFDAKDPEFGWAGGEVIWPPQGDAAVEEILKAPPILEALEDVIDTLGVGPGEPLGDLAQITYILPMAYTAIVVADAFARLDTAVRAKLPKSLGVACTFAGGDGLVVGEFVPSGWKFRGA